MTDSSEERILSIQSHVVFGYVGGKAAVFPLQCLGYDVDVVNTVNFSNHSGYGRFGGTRTTHHELESIFKSLEQNELLRPRRLLTGYIPGAAGLSAVADLVRKLKQQQPDMIYLLDPVLGDSGRLYVAPDVIPIYRDLLPLSTIISPNWFEVETLTRTELKDFPSLQRALKLLHQEHHVPNVVISSIPLKPWLIPLLPSSIQPRAPSDRRLPNGLLPSPIPREYLLCLSSSASHLNPSNENQISRIHAQIVPMIPGYFSGVGDLFSALLLGHYYPSHPTPTNSILALPTAGNCAPPANGTSNSDPYLSPKSPLSYAASLALTKTHAILQRTYDYYLTLPSHERQSSDEEKDRAEPLRQTKRMKGRELRLIQSQDIILGKCIGEMRWLENWKQFW